MQSARRCSALRATWSTLSSLRKQAVSAKLQHFMPPVSTNSHPGRHDSEEHRRRKQMPSERTAKDAACGRTNRHLRPCKIPAPASLRAPESLSLKQSWQCRAVRPRPRRSRPAAGKAELRPPGFGRRITDRCCVVLRRRGAGKCSALPSSSREPVEGASQPQPSAVQPSQRMKPSSRKPGRSKSPTTDGRFGASPLSAAAGRLRWR